MRVFTASVATESNSFSPVPTNLQSFKDSFYAPAGTHPDFPRPTTAPLWVLRRKAKERGWTVIEGLCAWAEPAAPTARATYEQLRDRAAARSNSRRAARSDAGQHGRARPARGDDRPRL